MRRRCTPGQRRAFEVQRVAPIGKEEGLKIVPAKNVPRIPDIPRPGTRATAKWGMRGKGGKMSPLTRWPRPILRKPRLTGPAELVSFGGECILSTFACASGGNRADA